MKDSKLILDITKLKTNNVNPKPKQYNMILNDA